MTVSPMGRLSTLATECGDLLSKAYEKKSVTGIVCMLSMRSREQSLQIRMVDSCYKAIDGISRKICGKLVALLVVTTS
jgi:hypothetical protein